MTWLDELRRQINATSLTAVSKAMGVSKTTISQLANGKYGADTAKMQVLVESVYMGHTVTCPVLGEIPKHKCMAHQNTKHVGSQPNAIRLWKACRSDCPNSELEERLNTPVRISTAEQHRPIPRQAPPKENVRPYDAHGAISRLDRQARTDADSSRGNYQRLYVELLQREIIALGSRYNRLLKQ
jgi:transcriptional regulator with XRE-family HTH domain